jgi:alkylation response protein AidB-like acyl-CoA dehydrogenase
MDFELTEEQKSLVGLVKDFCKREADPASMRKLLGVENLRDRYPWDIVKKAHDIGLRTLCVPAKWGGGSADCLTQVLVAEALAHWGGPIAIAIADLWRSFDVIKVCSDELQAEIFPQIMENPKFIMAAAGSEAEAATDIMLPYEGPEAKMVTFAHRDGDEWVINGEKQYCTGGGIADLLIVLARTEKHGPISQSTSRFLVPTNTAGFSIVRENDMTYNEFLGNTVLRFENVRVPLRYHIGPAMWSWNALVVPRGSAGLLPRQGIYLGDTERIYETLKEYTKTRVQGGKPIFEHYNVGPLVVDTHLYIETWKLLTYKCAWEYDQADEQRVPRSPTSLHFLFAFSKDVRMRICQNIAHACGVIGALKEYPFEEYIRSVFALMHPYVTRPMHLIMCMKYI